jgi:ubiquinone/menaquinone biosynthesis C-methylase UbiE
VSSTELDPTILAFYRNRYNEDIRLVRSRHGQMEFLRTQELLRRLLPAAPAKVLDVGGATGAHAAWLAADGYAVHLIDPVPDHVAQAAQRGGFSTAQGDARNLSIEDSSVDVVLLFGPLYHLIEQADRDRALAEAVRVARPGGIVCTAAIGRYAALLELAGLGRIDDATVPKLRGLIEHGIHHDEPAGFTTAYFHRPEGLAREMTDAGLLGVRVFGVEGPSVPALENASEDLAADAIASAIRCARMVESDPAIMATSPHLLGIGHAP